MPSKRSGRPTTSRPSSCHPRVFTKCASTGVTAPQASATIPYDCLRCSSKVVGAYCDLELIGTGSMGDVYRARRPDMRDQQVAIKIPKTSDEQFRKRFEREIAASAMLRHENIVRAFDCGEIEGRPFLAMELEDGTLLGVAVRTTLGDQPRSTLLRPDVQWLKRVIDNHRKLVAESGDPIPPAKLSTLGWIRLQKQRAELDAIQK